MPFLELLRSRGRWRDGPWVPADTFPQQGPNGGLDQGGRDRMDTPQCREPPSRYRDTTVESPFPPLSPALSPAPETLVTCRALTSPSLPPQGLPWAVSAQAGLPRHATGSRGPGEPAPSRARRQGHTSPGFSFYDLARAGELGEMSPGENIPAGERSHDLNQGLLSAAPRAHNQMCASLSLIKALSTAEVSGRLWAWWTSTLAEREGPLRSSDEIPGPGSHPR